MKVGIVCDLSYTRSIVLSTYYHTVKNLYGDVVVVKEPSDLYDLDMVFVGNEHFGPHRGIWESPWFISICNNKNIQVIIVSAEKILGSPFWHMGIDQMQKTIESFKNVRQYVWDADDCVKMNKKIMGYSVSKHYEGGIHIPSEKLNKCVFIGNYTNPEYEDRRKTLNAINQVIETDIITHFNGSWKEYLETFAKYRYVLSPVSAMSNAFCFRFYEALFAQSIPIHQIRSRDTLNYYPAEKQLEDSRDCIFFTSTDELHEKLKSFDKQRPTNMIWFEDKMRSVLVQDGVFVP